MTRSRIFALAVALVVASTLLTTRAAARQASVAEARLQAALTKEVVEGKCAEAIPLYQEVLTTSGISRATGAKALSQLAACFEKIGKPTDAQAVLRRLVADYPASAEAVAARARLAALPGGANSRPSEAPFSSVHSLDFIKPGPPVMDRVSPNGQYVDYAIYGRDGARQFYRGFVRALASGEEHTYLETSDVYYSVWSPDSTRLAVVTTEVVAGGFRSELKLVIASSGTSSTVSTHIAAKYRVRGWPAWSPDSRRLAFIWSDGEPSDIQIMSVGSGEIATLGASVMDSTNPALLWSPDGSKLAYRTRGALPGTEEFRVATLEAGGIVATATLPVPAGKRIQLLQWKAPDYIKGMVLSEPDQPQQYFVAPLGPAAPKVICETTTETREGRRACGEVIWPLKSVLVWDRVTRRYMLRNFETSTEVPLTAGSGDEDWLAVSADGRLASFVSDRDGTVGLYVVPLDRVPARNPLRIAEIDFNPAWGGDSGWLSNGLLHYTFSGRESRLVRIDMDPSTGHATGSPTTLNTDRSEKDNAAISPDGRQIASWTRRGSRAGISVISSHGAGERWLMDASMAFSIRPNEAASFAGAPLLWRSPGELLFWKWSGNPRGLTAVDTANGTTRFLFGDALPEGPPRQPFAYVSPTNEFIYPNRFLRGAESEIRARSAEGKERTIAKVVGLAGLAVGPDGSVAYTRAADPPNGIPAELRLVGADGKESVLLSLLNASTDFTLCALCPRAWSPDGRFLLYRDAGGKYSVMEVQTRRSWALFPQGGANWDGGAWSPDGTFIVLQRAASHNEWRAFEDVTYDAVIRQMDRRSGRD